MCEKTNFKYCPSTIDKCMRNFISTLNILLLEQSLSIVGCCCGHKKYPMTIIVRDSFSGKVFDLVSGVTIPRKKKFYKRDKQGYYYIPETLMPS